MNSIGHAFRVTTFGESHGAGLGVVVDGCPSGLVFDELFLKSEMARRKPGQSAIVTQRKEADEVEVLSGVFEGRTTGAPIAMLLRNHDAKSEDYEHIKDAFRPSHADYTWFAKYGHRDWRGGGRSSARETAARVAAGAVAKMYLKGKGVSVRAYVSQVGKIVLEKSYRELDLNAVDTNPVRCPDAETAAQMEARIREVRKEGDTVGGVVTCVVKGCEAGLGEPVFDKLHAQLGKAILSINACKGFEIGSGFSGAAMKGSEHNDLFVKRGGSIETLTNHSGGVQGGISNGMDIYFKAAFKPVATILMPQETLTEKGEPATIKGKGRHDPCVLPRAVPIVEAMAALVLADFFLRKAP